MMESFFQIMSGSGDEGSGDDEVSRAQRERERKQIITALKKQFSSSNSKDSQVNEIEVKPRNVLLIGRYGSGKTTLRQVLEDPTHVSSLPKAIYTVKESLSSTFDTLNPSMKLQVLIVPNLFDNPSDSNNQRAPIEIIDKICHEKVIEEIHLICFCASFNPSNAKDDVKILTRLVEHYKSTASDVFQNLCMVVTNCEKTPDNQRQELLNEIQQIDELSCFDKSTIFFSGALNRHEYDIPDKNALKQQFDNVCGYRKELLDFIYRQDHGVLINQSSRTISTSKTVSG